MIRDELERMSRLVDDLLLLARSDRPGFLRPEPIDLDLLTNDLFAKARLLGDRRWTLEGVGVGVVVADPHRLTSAVMNLAQNAVRHTRGDQMIAIASEISGAEARISVRDEGAGIEPARAGADLRALRARRQRGRRPRLGPGARDRPRGRRGARRRGRARIGARARAPASRSSSPPAVRRRGRPEHGADPDRRGRAAARRVPREGSARERLLDHGGDRRDRRAGRSPRPSSSTSSSSTSGCPGRTAWTSSATSARRTTRRR